MLKKIGKKRVIIFLLGILFASLGLANKVSAAPVNVGNWEELETKLADSTVTEIKVTKTLTATKNLTVSNNVSIDFGNNLVDLKTYSIKVPSGKEVRMKDIEITGDITYKGGDPAEQIPARQQVSSTGNLFSGAGSVVMTGNLKTAKDNLAGIAAMQGGSVTLDAVKGDLDKGDNASFLFESKNFLITNGSVIKSEAEKFFGLSMPENKGTVVRINQQSKVTTNSNKLNIKSHSAVSESQVNFRGQAWHIKQKADFYIEDKGTVLSVSGNGKQRQNEGGIFSLRADESTVNVLNEAEFDVHSVNTSAIIFESEKGVFNVKNNAKLNVVQDGDNDYNYAASIRFVLKGFMTFNIEGNSQMNIDKKTGKAPGIRMYGSNNQINVRSGSDFTVRNAGNGTPLNSGNGETGFTDKNGRNQGVYYTNGASNGFLVEDEDSNVSVVAENGPALDTPNYGMDVTSKDGTYFVVRGNTADKDKAIFVATDMNVNISNPKYFDFLNKNGIMYENSTKSKMSSINSDLSVWNVGSDFSGNPKNSWTLIDYQLSKINFDTIDSSNDDGFKKDFGKMSNYGKMTANNQSAKITDIRIPTNADKSIYAYVMVPEGKYEDDRPAYDEEVGVRIGLYDEQNNPITELTTRTSTESVYGDKERKGVAKFTIPNDEFIKEGTKIRVLGAWRGSGKEGSNKVHTSSAEDITDKEVTAIDVTPPKTVGFNGQLSSSMKNISGKGDENGSKLFFKYKGEWLRDASGKALTTTVNNGVWSVQLPKFLDKNTELEIFVKDKPTFDPETIKYDLPDTFTKDPDGVLGNINIPVKDYDAYKGYHDATGKEKFAQSLLVKVSDVMPPIPKITKLARSLTKDKDGNQIPQTDSETNIKPEEWTGTKTKVKNTVSYRIVVQIPGNPEEDKDKILYNANITDKLPTGLDFNKEDVKVWKYKKGNDADNGLPYRHEVDVNEGGVRKYNMGDIDIEKSEATEFTNTASINYQETTRLLTVGVGDKTANPGTEYAGDNQYGILVPGDKIVIEVPTVVTKAATNKKIENTAVIQGFANVIESQDPVVYKEVTAESNIAKIPGDIVSGELMLIKAPKNINFGNIKIQDYNKGVGTDKTSIDEPLVVKDTLKDKDWKVTIKLIQDFTYTENGKDFTLPESLYVRYNDEDTVLSLNDTVPIYESDLSQAPSNQEEFNISDAWDKDLKKDGIKFRASKVPRDKSYVGTVEWAVENTQ